MDIKRLLLALMLSFVFIVTWNVFFPPAEIAFPNEEDENIAQEFTEPQKQEERIIKTGPPAIEQIASNALITISTPLVELDIINGATSIKNLKIIENKDDSAYKHTGAWDLNSGVYDVNSPVQLIREGVCNPCLLIDNEPINFIDHAVEQKDGYQRITSFTEETIIKQTIIYDDSYTIDHIFTGLPAKNVVLLWDHGLLPSEKLIKDDMTYFSVYAQNQESYEEEYLSSIDASETFTFDKNVGWAGLKSKYFIKAISNKDYNNLKAEKVVFNAYHDNIIEGVQTVNSSMEYHYGSQDLNNGKLQVSSYIGPIDMEHLNQDQNKHLVQLFGFGWFFIGYLGKVVMWLLTTLYSIIPNYGIVCILFAFIIRIFTGPLTKKSFLSNQKMQAIQPKLKKIQEKQKDNKGQLNKEIMLLYKKEGVNPLGGCLPILIQMPLLIALFQVFRKTIEFRGASFLPFWITDLSQPDVVLQFAFLKEIWGINYFFGHGIALLPFIMGAVMFLNMKMTTTNNVNPSQTSTMYIMNGFFILLFNTFPSGLNLYYTVYNILNFLQQRKLQKLNS